MFEMLGLELLRNAWGQANSGSDLQANSGSDLKIRKSAFAVADH